MGNENLDYKLKLFSICFMVLLVTASVFFGMRQVSGEDFKYPSQLVEAGDALQNAFAAILVAENARTNVTGLLGRLNDGADLLAQANVAYRVGDVIDALDKAAETIAVASEVQEAAIRAGNIAPVTSRIGLLTSAIISLTCGFFFVVAMLLVWKRFKQGYVKRLCDSRPEVIE